MTEERKEDSDVVKDPFVVCGISNERRKSIAETSTMNLYKVNATPFSKSMPTSRKNSAKLEKRRSSLFSDGFTKLGKLPPLNVNNSVPSNTGILLDVTQLEDIKL